MSKLMQATTGDVTVSNGRTSSDLGEGMFRTSLEGAYLAVNPALAEIYGYGSPEQMMAELRDIQRQLYVNPSRRQEFIDAVERDSFVVDFCSQVFKRNGEIIWIMEHARSVRDEQGQLMFYEGTVRLIDR